MIKSITIKGVATFDETGIQITDLKKVNFIYGANACGKTTISNFLNDTTDLKYSNCSVTWKNELELKTLVYNKEFRERNFGKGKINGVFTLGEATTEEIKIIENKEDELKIIKADGLKKRETLNEQIQKKEKLEGDFKETSWVKIYKKYETVFKEAFVGSLNKENFKNKLLQEFVSNTVSLATFDELQEKAKTIFGELPQTIPTISIINFDRIIKIENDLIWKKIIVGKADVDIAKLIQKLNINDWVNQGRNYLQEGETCPFCQKITPQVTPQVIPQVREVVLVTSGEMSRQEIQDNLGLSDKRNFVENYLKPTLEQGIIEMTIPDKPNSRLQKYRLTKKGMLLKQSQ